MTRFKVCCIATIEEAQSAVRYGASAIGLVSTMPSGPGPIPEERIARIATTVPPGVATFLLTSETDADTIIAQHRRCRTNAIQLVDSVSAEVYPVLRDALPGIALIQVVHVVGEESFQEAVRLAPCVDAILLDSGNPSLPVKELGGTGRRHDWKISRRIRDAIFPTPVFLAGGLRPDNVSEVIEIVRPYALDVCSGVRTGDALDGEKLAAFVSALES